MCREQLHEAGTIESDGAGLVCACHELDGSQPESEEGDDGREPDTVVSSPGGGDEISSQPDEGCGTHEGMNKQQSLNNKMRSAHRVRAIRGVPAIHEQPNAPIRMPETSAKHEAKSPQLPALADVVELHRPPEAARCKCSIVSPDARGRFKVTVAVNELGWEPGTPLRFEHIAAGRIRIVATDDDGQFTVDQSRRASLPDAAMCAAGLADDTQLLLQADPVARCLIVTNTAEFDPPLPSTTSPVSTFAKGMN